MARKRNTVQTCAMALIIAGIPACGKDKRKSETATAEMDVQLLAVSAANPLQLAHRELSSALANSDTTDFTSGVSGLDWEKLAASFVPESFLYPIGLITTREAPNRAGGLTVYKCPAASVADCRVDLADAAAIKALLKDAKLSVTKEVEEGVDPGVLATIGGFDFSRCLPNDTVAKYKVKGTANFKGTTWYTTSKDGKVLTTNAADYDYVEIDAEGCGTPPYMLANPIALKKGDKVTVSLMVTLADIGVMKFYTDNTPAGDCATQSGLRRVCVRDPMPFPYAGDAAATVETYQISATDVESGSGIRKANLLLFIDPLSNEPMGATCRYNFDGTNRAWTRCPSDFAGIKKNSDGTYSLNIFTGADGTGIVESLSAFQRAGHQGSMTVKVSSDGTVMKFPYTATKL